MTKSAVSAVSSLFMLQNVFTTFNASIFKKNFKLHFYMFLLLCFYYYVSYVSIIIFLLLCLFYVCSILVLTATSVWNGQTTGWLSIRVNLAHSSHLTMNTRKRYGNRIYIFRSGKRVRYTTYFCRMFC